MSRSLVQLKIGQLEEMFASSKLDSKVLKQLEDELRQRKMPRAVSLLAEVQAAMSGVDSSTPSVATPISQPKVMPPTERQLDLWTKPSTVAASPSASTVTPEQPKQATRSATLTISVEEAYKLLKTTPSSTWESIEETRRQLVQQASPINTKSLDVEKRAQMHAMAQLINAAYETLFQQRVWNK